MTPEEMSQLRCRQWQLRAKPLRFAVSKVIARALGESPSVIVFADLEETNRISNLFSTHLDTVDTIEFPNREAAINFVTRELHGVTGPAYLLTDEYHECGAVILDFAKAIANIDEILQSQYECFRLMSANGNAGVCIVTQEGSAPHYPRYVDLWCYPP